jgi:hypothetical protein
MPAHLSELTSAWNAIVERRTLQKAIESRTTCGYCARVDAPVARLALMAAAAHFVS